MTILATGACPDGIESGGVGPLIRIAEEVQDASVRTLAKGATSGSHRGKTEEFERSAKFITEFGLRMDVFKGAKLTACGDEVLLVD